jgi:signal peptidase I
VAEDKTKLEELLDERPQGTFGQRAWAWTWDLLKTWGPALLAVLVIRSVVAEPFRIPSGSMVPTLEIGDFIIVNKFAYGLRFPFTRVQLLPVGEPERGDVIVFRYPPDPRDDYIKRVVAVPGDLVMVRRNTLYVNGEQVRKEFAEDYRFVDKHCMPEPAELYNETMDDKVHTVLYSPDYTSGLSEYGPREIQAGEVFVMGDNRDNSSDSRAWGTVPMDNIKGKALVVWLSLDRCAGKMLRLRLERFGSLVR